MMAHVRETEGTASAMVDSAAAAESDRLGTALVELEGDGVAYGAASLTVALCGELDEIERLDGDVRRLFAAPAAKAVREGFGQLPVWFSRLPAQPLGQSLIPAYRNASRPGANGGRPSHCWCLCARRRLRRASPVPACPLPAGLSLLRPSHSLIPPISPSQPHRMPLP